MPVSEPARQDGSAVVEFALVLPLLLVIALGLVQVGLLARDRLLVESAARAGERVAAVADDAAAVGDAVRRAAPDLDPSLLSVSISRGGGRGDPVTVALDYGEPIRVPLIAWLFGSSVEMHAAATDRQEFG